GVLFDARLDVMGQPAALGAVQRVVLDPSATRQGRSSTPSQSASERLRWHGGYLTDWRLLASASGQSLMDCRWAAAACGRSAAGAGGQRASAGSTGYGLRSAGRA